MSLSCCNEKLWQQGDLLPPFAPGCSAKAAVGQEDWPPYPRGDEKGKLSVSAFDAASLISFAFAKNARMRVMNDPDVLCVLMVASLPELKSA